MRIWFCHLVSFWLRLPPVTSRVRVSGMLTRGRECLKVPQSASMILHREATLCANTNIWGKSQTMVVFFVRLTPFYIFYNPLNSMHFESK